MVKLYFICMFNYYRSRLAEELAIHYAAKHGLEVAVDSGGLSRRMPNPSNPGPIAQGALVYLSEKGVQPRNAERMPHRCSIEAIQVADIIVCTDEIEQRHLFIEEFPDHGGKLICWQAYDVLFDPMLKTPEIIDRHVEELIIDLAEANN